MFCRNCGKPIEGTESVCPFCGTAVNKVTSEGNDINYNKIFVEPDENYIGSLGNKYLNSFLTRQEIE